MNGKHQCDFVDFCGAYGSHVVTTGCTEKAFATHKASIDVAIARLLHTMMLRLGNHLVDMHRQLRCTWQPHLLFAAAVRKGC